MNLTSKEYELCILIPCYNNLHGLRNSLQSIKYEDGKFLVVIVDDGSDRAFYEEDLLPHTTTTLPVEVIRIAENKGITVALNTGLQWIKDNIDCKYIARLDCGDLCDPERFYQQMGYLRVNPQVALLGSWCYFQEPGKNFRSRYKAPEHHKQIKRAMYFKNTFIHPTVIFRLDVSEKLGFYPTQYPHAEDYALFWKITIVGQTAIIPLYLVVCEANRKGISFTNRIKQLESRLVIVKDFGHNFALKLLGILKIKFLMKIPYSFILFVKKLI